MNTSIDIEARAAVVAFQLGQGWLRHIGSLPGAMRCVDSRCSIRKRYIPGGVIGHYFLSLGRHIY